MARVTFIGALLLLASACDLSDELEGEPCGVDKDCWHKQECARTDVERQTDLPGVCEDKGTGCVVGQQLGCSCDPENYEIDCSLPAVPSVTDYPEMMCEPTLRMCVLATPAGMTEG